MLFRRYNHGTQATGDADNNDIILYQPIDSNGPSCVAGSDETVVNVKELGYPGFRPVQQHQACGSMRSFRILCRIVSPRPPNLVILPRLVHRALREQRLGGTRYRFRLSLQLSYVSCVPYRLARPSPWH